MPAADSTAERAARTAGARTRQAPSGGSLLTVPGGGPGVRRLSGAGRRHFEPAVGATLERARLRVGGAADRLARLAGAEAVTYGDDVFVPGRRFSPHSAAGRALLGHELAHVAQRPRPRRLMRQPETEPHYPTAEEQREIEKILGREGEPQVPEPAQELGEEPEQERPPDSPAQPRGRSLSGQERTELAERLEQPFWDTLARVVAGASEPSAADRLGEERAFEVVQEARKEIYAKFGTYAVSELELTRDEKESAAERRAESRILVTFGSTAGAAADLARTILVTHCATCRKSLAGLDDESRQKVVRAVVTKALRERGAELAKAAEAAVGGSYSHGSRRINLPLESRQQTFETAVHELMHALAHPAFRAAFSDEDTVTEGFTEYFTRQVARGSDSYPTPVAKVRGARGAMKGPFLFSIRSDATEESLRLAYFRGRLDLIGWRPSGPEEEKAVEEAGGSAAWDPEVARKRVPAYMDQARRAQAASGHLLGLGLSFTRRSQSDPTISVGYARVLAETSPLARGRLLFEGQVLGKPVGSPRALGASLGIAGEYQEPYFYAGGGVRFVGSAVEGDGTRLDLSPFAGAGIRAWQRVRIGGEGFVALPLTGGAVQVGGGVRLTVELD